MSMHLLWEACFNPNRSAHLSAGFVLPFAMIMANVIFLLICLHEPLDFVFPKSVQWNHSSWSPALCLTFSCLWAQRYFPSVMRQNWLWVLASLLGLWPWVSPFLCLIFSCLVLVMVIENHDHPILRVYISHSIYGICWYLWINLLENTRSGHSFMCLPRTESMPYPWPDY